MGDEAKKVMVSLFGAAFSVMAGALTAGIFPIFGGWSSAIFTFVWVFLVMLGLAFVRLL